MTVPAPFTSGGTIFIAAQPVPLVEATILHEMACEEFWGARRAGNRDAMRIANAKEIALREVIWTAANWRIAAGWDNPADADLFISSQMNGGGQ